MMKTNVTVDVATSFLYKTRTMQALLDEKTEFCGKSINEIVYLLELELAGNMYEWRMQAIL